MKPIRAGIIGLWDYTDHVFAFADGRMVLRGSNGSGKTKALEVLFPFVLDGRLDPRRLDPFSGENRTMKDNLLWGRDGEAGYGYAWLEFGDGARYVTVGVGMVARRHQASPTPWFFVADGRAGEDVLLVEPDGRPRSRAQLRDALGEGIVVDRARDHRARVDAALFGLGAERYEAMLDLVLTLRRPMLAKDLDPGLLSDTLARGLRPLDDTLLEKVARSFDDLEIVQRELDRLATADDATQAFVTDYRGYLRTQARARADAAIDAEAGRRAASDRVATAQSDLDRARADEALAEAEASAAADALARHRGRRDALRDSDAFRSAADLEHLARSVRDLEEATERAVTASQAAKEAAAGAAGELERDKRAANAAATNVGRLSPQVSDDAAAAGIAWDGSGDDVRVLSERARAGTAARRADVDAVRARIDAVEDAARRVGLADATADRALEAREKAETDVQAADASVSDTRNLLLERIEQWSAAHSGVVDAADAEVVAAGVQHIGGDGPTPAESWRDRIEPRRNDAAGRRSALDVQAAGLAERDEALRSRRAAIVAETDDAPPPLPWRGGEREGRPGAPFWRLVRFADGLHPNNAAGFEAALEAAGLLDAWVRPDGTVEGNATADAFLDAATHPGPDARTLAAVLVPEAQADVAESVIMRLLAAVAIIEPGSGSVGVSAGGDYRLGPLAGHHRVDTPRYIGATARAAHRVSRLAALDEQLAAVAVEAAGVATRIGDIDRWVADADAATSSLPSVADLSERLRERERAGGRLQGARVQLAEAVAQAETLRRDHNDRTAALQREAGFRGLPTASEELRQVSDAIERFADDVRSLIEAIERAAERAVAVADATGRNDRAAAAAARAGADVIERARERDARTVELATLREQMGAAAEAVLAELDSVEAAISAGEIDTRRLAKAVLAAAASRGAAEGEVRAAGEALGTASSAADDAERRLAILRRADLAAPLGLPADASEADTAAFLTFVDELVAGVSAVEERRKGAQTRVTRGLEELEHALGAGYRPSWDIEDDVIVVTVGDDLGVRSVAVFAEGLASLRADQAILLHARERALFEDTLLSAVCRQIHERIRSTRDLVATMDAEMRARRLSSGQTVGVAWRAVDAATPDWKTVQRLLDGDPAHFGPEEFESIRRHFASEIALARAAQSDVAYRELLARVLDYRTWRRFELTLVDADGSEAPLTRARHARLSGGEKAASLHLPLFAAAHAAFAAARSDCPRLLALDEAFAGIDDLGRAELLSLTVAFDLDLFMTGFDLWATEPSVPAVAHHDLLHLPDEHAVSSLLVLWNGCELVEGPDAEDQLRLLGAGSVPET